MSFSDVSFSHHGQDKVELVPTSKKAKRSKGQNCQEIIGSNVKRSKSQRDNKVKGQRVKRSKGQRDNKLKGQNGQKDKRSKG